jgi:hypothetical protein
MKKLLLSSLLLFIVVIFNSCSSNNTAGGQVNPNSVGSPFTLKYEYVLTSPALNGPLGSQTFIYTNATGQVETASGLTNGDMTWTKTITVTTGTRPLFIQLGQATVQMSSAGSVTANIYINGTLKASSNNPSVSNSGFFYSIVPGLIYTVN